MRRKNKGAIASLGSISSFIAQPDFFASEEASYMTGASLIVDGGYAAQ